MKRGRFPDDSNRPDTLSRNQAAKEKTLARIAVKADLDAMTTREIQRAVRY